MKAIQIKMSWILYLTQIRMLSIKKTNNSKFGQEYGGKRNMYTLLVGIQINPASREISMMVSQEIKK
jgi:hypothetical protein